MLRIFKMLIVAHVVCIFIISCSTGSKPTLKANDPIDIKEQSSDLTWAEAQDRKSRLSDVTYELFIDISNATSNQIEASFSGDVVLRFTLKDANRNLRLDFSEGEIKSIVVNGSRVDADQKKKYWIELPGSVLLEGRNEVRIEYTHVYSRTGEGLHRFVDPVDKQVYLYTQFETYDANRFMPCFDQPDLRSVLTLSVRAPKAWHVVSSVFESTKKLNSDGTQVLNFGPSAKISTYLFSLHAGPYHVFSDQVRRNDGTVIPLRIMVRPSLKSFLKHREWFQTTKDGIAFFENYFGVRYPFEKLDQVVVPEFNAGGMENVAAITYTEHILPRSTLTRTIRRGISSLQLHEIAHMWFGDLVTMAWWNNLWLNESFATYMSTLAQAEATEFKEIWQTFAASTKSRAYVEDAMKTTHPIEANIATVKEAMTNFDAITYNKGASVLKQLNYYMTAQEFAEGVKEYFKTYAYQNTTLSQFIGSLQNHTKKDLSLWADRWLRQSGTDLVSTSWRCDGDRLKQMAVRLETSVGSEPRPQSLKVGLFNKSNSSVGMTSSVRIEFDGHSKNQTSVIKGDWPCPEFVYPNFEDHGYVLVRLDENSLKFLTENLFKLNDSMVRTLVWNDLWRMVRDTELNLRTYVEIVANNFKFEMDEIALRQVLGSISRPSGSIVSYWPVATEAARAERTKFVTEMEFEFERRLKASKSGSDDEKLWYDAFTQIAESPRAMERLYQWSVSGRISKKFSIDLERGWAIASLLVRFSHKKADYIFSLMKKRDRTDRGLKSALSIEASRPDLDIKRKWINEFIGDKASEKFSLEESEYVLYSLFPTEQRTNKLKFSKDFFQYLEKNRKSEDYSRVGVVLGSLTPLDCNSQSSQVLKTAVAGYSDMNPSFKKRFLMGLEEDERCQRVREKSNL